MKRWHFITESNRLGQIYSEPPIVAYTKTFWSELKFLHTFNNNITHTYIHNTLLQLPKRVFQLQENKLQKIIIGI